MFEWVVVRVQVGSGVQIFCATLVTLLLAAAGFLSPASRGALLTSAIILYLLLAVSAGYAAVLLYANMTRSLEGWTGICLKTACYVPGARPAAPSRRAAVCACSVCLHQVSEL